MDKISLTQNEFEIFKKVCQAGMENIQTFSHENNIIIEFSEVESIKKCFELITEALQYDGFSIYYNPTPNGIIYEKLIDKFTTLMQT